MEHKKQDKHEKLIEGLERLAFGNIADVIQLLYAEELDSAALGKLDLFQIAEVKRPKGGGMEIKLYDRLKALQYLQELYDRPSGDAFGFYNALAQGVKTFEEEGH